MSKINTLLFDCDNTLVLSEELAFEGCADLINEICDKRSVPIPDRFTGATLIKEFVGQNFRGMMLSLQQRYGFEMGADELESYVRREEDVVIAKLRESLRPCPGVDAVLAKVAARQNQKQQQVGSTLANGVAEGGKKYDVAVVSSSALRRVQASLDKVGQDKYFAPEHVFSAASSLPKPTSKPDPAIYLHAMKVLGKKPEECVAIEDSKSGTLSATRAGIKTIGYVGPYADDKKPEMEKVLTESGAVVIMRDWSEFESLLAKLEKESA